MKLLMNRVDTNTLDRAVVDGLVENPLAPDLDRLLLRCQLEDVVEKVLVGLDEREREVLESRFGLRGEEMTLDEVAATIRSEEDPLTFVTRERVRQIEAKALRKLRHPTRTFHLRPFVDLLAQGYRPLEEEKDRKQREREEARFDQQSREHRERQAEDAKIRHERRARVRVLWPEFVALKRRFSLVFGAAQKAKADWSAVAHWHVSMLKMAKQDLVTEEQLSEADKKLNEVRDRASKLEEEANLIARHMRVSYKECFMYDSLGMTDDATQDLLKETAVR